jgi:hypothetical protein
VALPLRPTRLAGKGWAMTLSSSPPHQVPHQDQPEKLPTGCRCSPTTDTQQFPTQLDKVLEHKESLTKSRIAGA